MFHFGSTLLFDLMLENKLFAFMLFHMGISDSVLDQIGFEHFVGKNCGQKQRCHCISLYKQYISIVGTLLLYLYMYVYIPYVV